MAFCICSVSDLNAHLVGQGRTLCPLAPLGTCSESTAAHGIPRVAPTAPAVPGAASTSSASCDPPIAERRLGEDPLADLLDKIVRLWVNRRSSRLRRKVARSPLAITSRTRGILITTVRSEPCMYSLKMNLAKNMSGVILRACEQRARVTS